NGPGHTEPHLIGPQPQRINQRNVHERQWQRCDRPSPPQQYSAALLRPCRERDRKRQIAEGVRNKRSAAPAVDPARANSTRARKSSSKGSPKTFSRRIPVPCSSSTIIVIIMKLFNLLDR